MTKHEIEHSYRARRGRQKVLVGEEKSYSGGCLMTIGLILGVGLIIWLYFSKNLDLKTSFIIGGIVGGLLIIIGFFKKIGGEIIQDEGYNEEWVEEGGKRKRKH